MAVETDPSIALSGRPPAIVNPTDALAQAQALQQSQQRIAQQNIDNQARQLQLDQANDQENDRKIFETTINKNAKFNPDTGQLDYDDAGIANDLKTAGKQHLYDTYTQNRDKVQGAHRDYVIKSIDDSHKASEAEGTQAENFLALDDATKAAQYPQLRRGLIQIDPQLASSLPPTYDPSIAPALQSVVDTRNQMRSTKDQLEASKSAEALKESTPEGLRGLLDEDRKTVAQAMGIPEDKVPDEIMQGFIAARMKGFKPATVKKFEPKVGTMNGKPFNANYDPQSGKYLDPANGQDVSDKFEPKDPAVAIPAAVGEYNFYVKQEEAAGRKPLSFDEYQSRDANRKKSITNINNQSALTDAGIDAAAQMFAKTGIMPALGMNSGGARSQIINRAAQLMPGIDIASNKADYNANTKSLDQATKLRDALTSFESTATKNMKILEDSAAKVLDSGSPLLNKPLRSISESALGSTDLPVYRAARQIVVNEVAKLTNNPNLTGTLSDSARHEIETLMPPDMTMKQLVALLPTLKQDMANRTSSVNEQIGAIRDRIKGPGSGAPAPSTSRTFDVTDPKGGVHKFASQADADAFKKAARIQ